jgi:hypothetical protein
MRDLTLAESSSTILKPFANMLAAARVDSDDEVCFGAKIIVVVFRKKKTVSLLLVQSKEQFCKEAPSSVESVGRELKGVRMDAGYGSQEVRFCCWGLRERVWSAELAQGVCACVSLVLAATSPLTARAQHLGDEPLLRPNAARFVIFPQRDAEIWAMYKKAEGESGWCEC